MERPLMHRAWRTVVRAETAFVVCSALLVFGYGVAVGLYKVFPFAVIKHAQDSLTEVFAQRQMLAGTRPTEFLSPARYPGAGVTVNRPGEVSPGLTLIAGFFEGDNQIRLIDAAGTVVTKWPVRYSSYFPDPAHVSPTSIVPATDWNTEVHGVLPLPDGSVVFNFNYLGTVKLDRCGQTLWTLPRMTHHVVSPAVDGGLWIPSSHYITGDGPFPRLERPFIEDTILKVAPDGTVQREISVLEILHRNHYQGVLRQNARGDLTHVNDVEELRPEVADRFPGLAAGDLMISMRMGSRVIVVDPETLQIKWYQAGPWVGQHDPDFLPDGRILIFNNNADGTDTGSRYGGSNVMTIDPVTRAVAYRYGDAPGERMFTESSGKHQALPGGHLLVTEARVGRAFEVDAGNHIVWEFINRYDDADAAQMSEVTRYPPDYFTVTDWRCPATSVP